MLVPVWPLPLTVTAVQPCLTLTHRLPRHGLFRLSEKLVESRNGRISINLEIAQIEIVKRKYD